MANLVAWFPLWVWIGFALLVICLLALLPSLLESQKKYRRDKDFSGGFRYPAAESTRREITKSVPMVSYVEVKGEYERKRQLWETSRNQMFTRQGELDGLDYRAMDVAALLHHVSAEELGNLTAIIGIDGSAAPSAIIGALRKAGSHGVASMIRGGPVPYEEVVNDVAVKLGAKNIPKSISAAELERLAVGAAMDQMLAKASPEERKAILAELTKNQATSPAALMTATGGLILANLSGFGLYVAASSSLAAITGAVGLTLPFAVYTGMSSVLAAVTGPVGWAALALVAIFKFGGAEYKKTVPGVICIAASRARLIAHRDEEIAKLRKQQTMSEETGRRLAVLAKFVDDMFRVSPDHSVPRASVPW